MNWQEYKENLEAKFDSPITLEWGGWEIGWRASVREDWLNQYGTGYRKISALKDLEVKLEWVFGPDGRSPDGCPSEDAHG